MRNPLRGASSPAVNPPGRSAKTSIKTAASVTVLVSGPTWSREKPSGNTPSLGNRPKEGLNPTTPQHAAGMRMEPPVSVPMEKVAMPNPTDAALPLLEPPDKRPGAAGLATGPNGGFSPFMQQPSSWQ